jgi:hypothetical protein
MKLRKDLLVLAILLIAIISTGVFLPPLLVERKKEDTGFATAVPTSTASLPLISFVRTPTGTPFPIESANCTYHSFYWKERPEVWPTEVVLGEMNYHREEIRLYFSTETNDLQAHLITQMYTAFLNILYGADISTIHEILIQADNWLALNPTGGGLSEFNLQRGRELAGLLEGYNLGIFGPGACLDAPPTPTAVPTQTPPSRTNTPTEVSHDNPPSREDDADPGPVDTGSSETLPKHTPTATPPVLTPPIPQFNYQ